MKYTHLLAISVAAALAIAGCAKNVPPGAADAPAIVNDVPIDATAFKAYVEAIEERTKTTTNAEQRNTLLDQFIVMQLASDLAAKKGLDQAPEIEAQLKLGRMNLLSEALLKQYAEQHPNTEPELKAEYDHQVATMGRQYKVRQIVVESKAVADDLITQLLRGADFAKMAEKESRDGTAKQGGDMGWISLNGTLAEFRAPIAALERGKFTNEPVQSPYGWHILKLEDYRTPEPPTFEQARDRVNDLVRQKKLIAYMEELRKGAKIKKQDAAPEAAATSNTATEPPPAAK